MPPTPAHAEPNAAALLAEMRAVRERIEADAARVSVAADRATDWTTYVKAAPLACAAGAAVAGYLLVPARRAAPKPVPARRGSQRSPAATAGKPVRGRGPWMGAMTVLGNVAVRAGTAYLSQQAGKAFGSAAAGAAAEPERPARQPTGPR